MSAEHNHPARCCCEIPHAPTGAAKLSVLCPACPEHGVLAPAGVVQKGPACHESADGWCMACSTVWGPVYHPKEPAAPYTEQETTK